MTPTNEIRAGEREGLGEPPYFFAPYPDELVQVAEPRTRGEKRVVELIHEHWPVDSIDEIVEISREKYEDGYTGSFIRNVARTHYAPADMMHQQSIEGGVQTDETPTEYAIDEAWHGIFRMGIRSALQRDVPEEEALDAFQSGYREGLKLRDEMD